MGQVCDSQEMASYYAWQAMRERELGNESSAIFFQEEAAHFYATARFILGLHD